MTRIFAFANSLSVCVLPSIPGSENDGIGEPTASVGGCSEAKAAAQRNNVRNTERTNVRRIVCMIGFPLREGSQLSSNEPEVRIRKVANVGQDPRQIRRAAAEPARERRRELIHA